jgi:hypothetical protein
MITLVQYVHLECIDATWPHWSQGHIGHKATLVTRPQRICTCFALYQASSGFEWLRVASSGFGASVQKDADTESGFVA